MSGIESDYTNYENAKDLEEGLHPGRSSPSRGLVLTAAILLGLLVAGGIVLAVLPP
jgi:hypothetical protein